MTDHGNIRVSRTASDCSSMYSPRYFMSKSLNRQRTVSVSTTCYTENTKKTDNTTDFRHLWTVTVSHFQT